MVIIWCFKYLFLIFQLYSISKINLCEPKFVIFFFMIMDDLASIEGSFLSYYIIYISFSFTCQLCKFYWFCTVLPIQNSCSNKKWKIISDQKHQRCYLWFITMYLGMFYCSYFSYSGLAELVSSSISRKYEGILSLSILSHLHIQYVTIFETHILFN